jgi:hypothetical protein
MVEKTRNQVLRGPRSAARRAVTTEAKVKVFLAALAVLMVGFMVVVVRPGALEAYRVAAEWTVYLAAALFVGNAAASFTAKRR